MNDQAIQTLRDALLRRALTANERHRLQQWLAQHPDAAEAWRDDERLAHALHQQRVRTPSVPDSFTAQVMSSIRRETARDATPRESHRTTVGVWNLWQRWISLAAAALVLLSAITFWERRHARADAEFARQVSALRFIAEMPSGLLQDYDAIQRFGEATPAVDYELLAALQ